MEIRFTIGEVSITILSETIEDAKNIFGIDLQKMFIDAAPRCAPGTYRAKITRDQVAEGGIEYKVVFERLSIGA